MKMYGEERLIKVLEELREVEKDLRLGVQNQGFKKYEDAELAELFKESRDVIVSLVGEVEDLKNEIEHRDSFDDDEDEWEDE